MLLRRLFFSAFLVGASLIISAFTFALSEYPFRSLPESRDLQSLPISSSSAPNLNQTLYEKYGGYAVVKKIVDDTNAILTVDPVMAPFLVTESSDDQATSDRVLSCLDQQFSSLLGGPYTYPSISHFRAAPEEGYDCEEFPFIQPDLSASAEGFDRFMVILSDVLKRHGVEPQDVDTIARSIAGLRNNLVER